MRTNPSTALAARQGDRTLISARVFEGRSRATVTTALEQFTVHVNHALVPSEFMKTIDVLRTEEKAFADLLLQSSERQVAGIRLGCGRHAPPH
jgi:hypothetical protein